MKKVASKKQIYATTTEMAEIVGRSEDWLRKKMRKGYLKLDVHYFRPPGERNLFWKIDAVVKWIEQPSRVVDEILEKMLS